jgi:hypothetical protein
MPRISDYVLSLQASTSGHPQYGTGSVSPFSPTDNPLNSNFIPANTTSSVAGLFLKANTINSDGGGRVIRYQLKFMF